MAASEPMMAVTARISTKVTPRMLRRGRPSLASLVFVIPCRRGEGKPGAGPHRFRRVLEPDQAPRREEPEGEVGGAIRRLVSDGVQRRVHCPLGADQVDPVPLELSLLTGAERDGRISQLEDSTGIAASSRTPDADCRRQFLHTITLVERCKQRTANQN